MIDSVQKNFSYKLAGVLRILLGFVFFVAGILKIVVPSLGQAFSGQLIAASIPVHGFVLFTFPIVETVIGVFLLVGFQSRPSAAAAAASMVVATYVHVAVEDPSLFPLQPVEPVGPLMLLAMAIYVMWRGGNALSIEP